MTVPRSQQGYLDIPDEMRAVDSVGPLARKAFNEAPREISAKGITATYKASRIVDLLDSKQDQLFADWIAREYRRHAGHSINDILMVRRIKKTPARSRG
jgi:hypothetical protein